MGDEEEDGSSDKEVEKRETPTSSAELDGVNEEEKRLNKLLIASDIAAERIEKANEAKTKLNEASMRILDKQEKMAADAIIAGKSDAVAKANEETPKEYMERVMNNDVKETKAS